MGKQENQGRPQGGHRKNTDNNDNFITLCIDINGKAVAKWAR